MFSLNKCSIRSTYSDIRNVLQKCRYGGNFYSDPHRLLGLSHIKKSPGFEMGEDGRIRKHEQKKYMNNLI